MRTKYLIRLDDACPTMDKVKWQRIEDILTNFSIRPMVGVIPSNADPEQIISESDNSFWDKVRAWESKGWAIALHGFDHCYISQSLGINPLWKRSEFAGVPLDVQKRKISEGVRILRSHGIDPIYFFAPSHTFDENTLIALKECSNIRIISDTIATRPYSKDNFVFIPQFGGRCRKMMIPGTFTFCFHPNTMDDNEFSQLQDFIIRNWENIIGFNDLDLSNLSALSFTDSAISALYFCYRRFRELLK